MSPTISYYPSEPIPEELVPTLRKEYLSDSTREPDGEGWQELANTGLFIRRSTTYRWVSDYFTEDEDAG
jgi:hypothetical protein